MGGGAFAKRGKGLVVLAVVPFAQEAAHKALAEIKKELPDLELHYYQQSFFAQPGEVVKVPEELLKRVDALVTLTWLPKQESEVPKIKFIQFVSAGVNHVYNHPIYADTKIPICNASGVHGPQIAEWVVMMHLAYNHAFISYYENQKKKEWKHIENHVTKDNVGKTVGILGYGSIGRQVARVVKALGMNVLAYTASPRSTPESKHDNGFIVPGTGDEKGEFPSAWYSGLDKASLHAFLKEKIDLLVVAVPLTPQTTHFLSTPEFALLHASNPSGTFIINIARGAVLSQSALITALETGQIAGAALDVTDPEPLPADSPLWDAPNVLITPHVSASTDMVAERCFQVVGENLKRMRDGRGLVNVVDREKGYRA